MPCNSEGKGLHFSPIPEAVNGGGDSMHIGALALHLMTNTAVTGATFDIDAGQQLGISARSFYATGRNLNA